MKKLTITLLILLGGLARTARAQNLSDDIVSALKSDDAAKIAAYVTADNINACYGNYSLLAQTVRFNAKKCFDVVIAKGANVNQVCNGYKSELFFAVEYGRLDMAKILVSKGADTKFKYNDVDLFACAGEYKQDGMIEYLKTLK